MCVTCFFARESQIDIPVYWKTCIANMGGGAGQEFVDPRYMLRFVFSKLLIKNVTRIYVYAFLHEYIEYLAQK